MVEITEPSEWLFDGHEPQRDLPASEAAQVTALDIVFDEPICTQLSESAVAGVRELFRGFFAHTPYRRIRTVELVDAETIAVFGEKRASTSDDGGWEPHIHDRDVAALQSELIEFFGPLWRVRRRADIPDQPGETRGVVEISRVVGRRFHYPGAEGDHND